MRIMAQDSQPMSVASSTGTRWKMLSWRWGGQRVEAVARMSKVRNVPMRKSHAMSSVAGGASSLA